MSSILIKCSYINDKFAFVPLGNLKADFFFGFFLVFFFNQLKLVKDELHYVKYTVKENNIQKISRSLQPWYQPANSCVISP